MAYDIVFTCSADEAFNGLESDEQIYIQKKLDEIASSEFRHPRQWDFKVLNGQFEGEGRFRIGDDLRVFADIDDTDKTIRVHRVNRRENLYQ